MKTTLDHLLSTKPSGGTKWVLQALLLALGIQVFTLAIVFLTTSNGYSYSDQPENQPVQEEIPLMLEEETGGVDQESNNEPMKNVMSESGGKLGDVVGDYRGQTSGLTPEQFEAQEFERLRAEHANDPKPQLNPIPNEIKPKDQNVTSNSSTTSYQGAVSVEWKMAGRSVSQGPKPTYRCKQAGVVQVNVMIDDRGAVKQASIDPSSTLIDCLRDESLSHAKRWKFNADLGKTNQTGTIVFRFAAQ